MKATGGKARLESRGAGFHGVPSRMARSWARKCLLDTAARVLAEPEAYLILPTENTAAR